MAFVRLKRSRGTSNYYLVASVWKDGKASQRVIAYLGTEASGLDSPEKAADHWEKALSQTASRKKRAAIRRRIGRLKPYVLAKYRSSGSLRAEVQQRTSTRHVRYRRNPRYSARLG